MVNFYENARALLKGRKTKKYDHNTYIRIDDTDPGNALPSIIFKLHATDIVGVMADGTVTLDSGGWRSATTKDRMNKILRDLNGGKWQGNWQLWQHKGVWYVGKQGSTNGHFVFADGMTISPDGTVSGTGNAKDIDALSKQIKKYVSGYVDALLKGKVPEPSAGDCWYCSFRTVDDNKPMGDVAHSDHILLHFKDKYYVPSLLVNATDFRDMSVFAKGCVGNLWRGQKLSDWESSITRRDVTSALTHYLKHQLGVAT